VTARVGIDLTSVAEVADAIREHGDHYLTRVYTAREVAECGGDATRLAARFAAKEAVRKVLGLGDGALGWPTVECVRTPDGNVAIALSGKAAELAAAAGLTEFAVSITHEAGLAAAVVIAEIRPEGGPPPDTVSAP
jgi:holo-[acyl-carrier protein] synthase